MRRPHRYLAMVLAAAMAGSALTACGKTDGTAESTAASASEAVETTVPETSEEIQETAAETTEQTEITYVPSEDPDITPPEGYNLIWHDEFDGDEIDTSSWAQEYHRPGWVNNELQTYVQDGENIFVEDGDLVIQPMTGTNDNGRAFYSSGRINTYHLHAFQYGRVEARIRVPEGQGFLPAFWMMSDDESYGSWPKSGEIDIMEILGSDTDTLYGTLHYGNPHRQNQGIYDLPSGDFASEYHVFAIEWEPGEIRWYCDDVMYYSTSYWYSAMDGQEPNPYPAPFNQPFYIILSVAVGGNWPGDPDETTPFDERAQMRVDYVRVFRMDSYDENVTCPEPELRDPDDSGNYIIDGISGPDVNYIRYFGDETLDLTSSSQHFDFTFDMEESTDGNARLEFNMGNFGSTAEVHITNVRLERAD